jgi:hypothetical protein
MTRITPQVEAMARAIHDAEWHAFNADFNSKLFHPDKERSWLDLRDVYISAVAPAALSALAACPPSEGMVIVGAAQLGLKRWGIADSPPWQPSRTYTAMLARAVEEAKDE